MSLKIQIQEDNKVLLEFENIISIWNILKYLVETAYLKQYVVENYEGGNTLVPKETWHEENIMYQEIRPNTYFFPYESIGFVIDDSIHRINFSVIDNYQSWLSDPKKSEILFCIEGTDKASLVIDREKISSFAALYFLAVMKIGFDKIFLQAFQSLLEGTINLKEKKLRLEYVSSSLMLNLKRIGFILKTKSERENAEYFKIVYAGRKFRKELIKEKDIKNISLLKKKLIDKNKYFFIAYKYSIPLLFGILIAVLLLSYLLDLLPIFRNVEFFAKSSKFFSFLLKLSAFCLAIYLAAKLFYSIFKKNAYKIISPKK